ncbi:MAG: DNA adenine methylase [Propionibacteriaceae bacterium]|nr:DNA adenine methylase [Propionibacteriaceae bacterium]
MIKYLGSKRLLVPTICSMAVAAGARTAVDLFTGTTRVAQALKRAGIFVTASDLASYSQVFSDTYIATDAEQVNLGELRDAIARLNALPGKAGYFTQTFCVDANFLQPKNGERVDAIRDAIEDLRASWMYPVLLTSLVEAADRVDSTTGMQMAYLKHWAPRSFNDLELRVPELIGGPGATVPGDAMEVVDALPNVDVMYLDPPYNQHRYFTNYHIWETLVRWDDPPAYGIARKRADARDEANKSVFNRKREMPAALASLIARAKAEMLLVSYNDEAWISAEQMLGFLSDAGFEEVRMLAFDNPRYVGAQIGIHNLKGQKVGSVSHLRNLEYIFIAGPKDKVEAAAAAAAQPAIAAAANPAPSTT